MSASVTLTHLPRMVSPGCGAAVARVISESRVRRVLIGLGLAIGALGISIEEGIKNHPFATSSSHKSCSNPQYLAHRGRT